MFSIFAGCSLVSVARYTSGFKLKSELADSLIVGLLLLILIQVSLKSKSLCFYTIISILHNYSSMDTQLGL